jgi:hypothetical protein
MNLFAIGSTEINRVASLEVVQLVNLMPLVVQKLMNTGLYSQADFLKATENLMRCYFEMPQNQDFAEFTDGNRRTEAMRA